MTEILPIPMQCKYYENESVSSYALHAKSGITYMLIGIFRYLFHYTLLPAQNCKQNQFYENGHFQLEYRF